MTLPESNHLMYTKQQSEMVRLNDNWSVIGGDKFLFRTRPEGKSLLQALRIGIVRLITQLDKVI